MIRLSRKRRRDPIFQSSTAAKTKYLSGANAPKLKVRDDDVILEVSVQDLCDRLPDYDEETNYCGRFFSVRGWLPCDDPVNFRAFVSS